MPYVVACIYDYYTMRCRMFIDNCLSSRHKGFIQARMFLVQCWLFVASFNDIVRPPEGLNDALSLVLFCWHKIRDFFVNLVEKRLGVEHAS